MDVRISCPGAWIECASPSRGLGTILTVPWSAQVKLLPVTWLGVYLLAYLPAMFAAKFALKVP